MTETTERRKHIRYEIKGEVLAILKPHPIKIGHIKNISEGGMSVNYIENGNSPYYYNKIDIFLNSEDSAFKEVEFTTIKDEPLPSLSSRKAVLKKSCLKFNGLNNQKKTYLKHFIDKYTLSPVQDRRRKVR